MSASGELNTVLATARELLPQMRDPASGLYAHKTTVDAMGRYVHSGANPLYTAVAVIGALEQAHLGNGREPAGLGETLDALYSRWNAGTRGLSLYGCMLWVSALAGDPRLAQLLNELPSNDQLRAASSQDLGLLLAGLAKAQQFGATLSGDASACLGALRDEAIARYCPQAGLFRAMGRRRRENVLNGRLTSFASQVYLIHGFAQAHQHMGDALPGECGMAAERIVDCQGSLGQWWWLYSAKDGSVIEGYPVYAVHQDAMALMALAPLHNLGHGNYEDVVRLGLRWLAGANELHESLINREPPMVFRCVQRIGSAPDDVFGISRANRARAALASIGVLPAQQHPAGAGMLEMLRECRAYHLAWALYAATLVSGWPLG